MRFLLILSLGLWPLFAGPAAAQPVVNPGDDLTAALGAAGDGGTVTLAAGDYSAPLEVIGQSVTVAGGGARFDGVAGQSIVYLDAAASLTLTDATLQTGDGEQAGIFLDGGALTLRDVRLSGPFRFAIYATAGSRLVLERVAVEGAANGLYLLDDVQFSLTEGEFIDLGELAIGAFGAKVIGKAEGVAVTGATESGLMVRDGATMDLRRASFSGMTGRALYLDNGGTLDAAEITITDAAAGLAAFGAGAITLDQTRIDGFGQAAITVDGAERLALSNLEARGEGNALATGGAIAEVSMVDASLANTGADRATVFLGHSGATALRQVAASGPYVAVYLQGTRGAITDISYSEFAASGFAAAVLQAMPAEDPANSVLFDTVRLDGSGDAVALALDSVSLARVVNSELVARGSAPLSFYESGRLEASGSILLGAADHWALGSAETDLEEPSKANVIRTGIDFASADFAALLGEAQDAREAAEIAALELGQVRVVNETGVPAFGEAAELELENAEGEVFALSLASPVEVPGGQYRFRVDGVEQGEVSVSADAPLQLELPDPQHPWFAFWDGERYLRGPAMRLRPRAELARNWAARSVLVHSYRAWLQTGFAERRTGLAPEDSAAILAEARAAYFANFATAHQGYLNQNASEEDRMGQATQYALAPVLAALGTAEDVPALLDLLPADYSFPRQQAVDAAALIATRSGLLGEAPLLTRARAVAAESPGLAVELAVASGLMGNREAIDFLIETFSAPNLDAERLSYPSAAFELMARVDDPRVLAIFRTALAEYGEAMHALMLSGEQRPQRSSHGLLFHHIPLAMEYVAVFGDEGDQALLAVPVGGSRLVDSTIAGLLADPVAVYLDMVGVTPRPQPVSDYGAYQMVNYGVLMCRALERRDATTREAFLEDFRYLAGEVLNTAYFGMTNDRAPGIVGRAVTNITTAYCNPNDRAASARRSDPRNLEVFADPITNFVWDDRPVRAEMALEGFDPTGRLWPNMAMLSQMPPADVLARMDADARFDSPLGAALRLNVRALDYRYVEPAADIYPGGANRRVFLTALAASDEEAVVSGRVDLSPILADGELQLGLRLRVVYDEKGFLTPQMTGRDVAMKAALSDAARGLVREVRLEGPDGDRPVPFRQTTEGGVHVFALPFAADDPAGFSVIVELEVFEQRWTLRFPLSYGDFAFRHRSKLP